MKRSLTALAVSLLIASSHLGAASATTTLVWVMPPTGIGPDANGVTVQVAGEAHGTGVAAPGGITLDVTATCATTTTQTVDSTGVACYLVNSSNDVAYFAAGNWADGNIVTLTNTVTVPFRLDWEFCFRAGVNGVAWTGGRTCTPVDSLTR